MDSVQITPRTARRTACICGLLLLIFAIISYSAALTKNATIDEPTHAMSGWLALREGDFRLETVNPSLWKCWAALGNVFSNPTIPRQGPIWKDKTWDPVHEVVWSSQTLFNTPGFDGDAFINRSRAMMLLIGLGLGSLIAVWSYQLAGPIAAVAATLLFCFDPTFIAHTLLVKSDVTFALIYLAIAYAIWRLGQRACVSRIIVVGVLCGVAVNVKYSGLIVGPLLALMLLIRATLFGTWSSFSRRLITAVGTGIFAVICCVAVTWACYGFRFRPAPSQTVSMDMQAIYDRAQLVETTAELGRAPTSQEIAAHASSLTARTIRFLDDRRLLPQAMLAGLLYQHSCVQMWPAFLNGDRYGTGRWTYFPLAMVYKTPVAELLAFGLAGVVLIVATKRPHPNPVPPYREGKQELRWTFFCLFIPFSAFAAAALTTRLNIGLRNVLPLYPFLEITAGCAAAMAWKRRPKLTRAVIGVLGAAIIAETLSAWPDYIAFFNFPTGGETGGISHLADSNLDWGQDIKSLVKWQHVHADRPLYARLYESVDPQFYGLKFEPLSVESPPDRPAYIAVSATHLQGMYIRSWEQPFYDRLRKMEPVAILGGTIYVYEYQPAQSPAPRASEGSFFNSSPH